MSFALKLFNIIQAWPNYQKLPKLLSRGVSERHPPKISPLIISRHRKYRHRKHRVTANIATDNIASPKIKDLFPKGKQYNKLAESMRYF